MKSLYKYFHLFTFATILAINLSGCRKKELDNVQNLVDFDLNHCENAVMDADENGEDCGGLDCIPCSQFTPPCSAPVDSVRVKNSSLPVRAVISKMRTGFSYMFNLEGGGFINFLFHHKPSLTSVYEVEEYASYNTVNVEFKYKESEPVYRGTGQVYYNFNDSSYFINTCYLGIETENGNPLYTVECKLRID